MSRMDRWNRVLMEQREPNGNLSDLGGGIGSQEETLENQNLPESQTTQNSPTDTNEGNQSPFSHPSLRGKTEEEIAEMIRIQELTVREQGRRLNALSQERSEPRREEPPPVQTPFQEEKDPTSAEFFVDPIAHIRRENAKTEKKIENLLAQMIKPFREDLSRNKVSEAKSVVRQKYQDFGQYEGLVDTLLAQSGVNEPSPEHVEFLYATAVGMAQLQGRNGNNGQPTTDNGVLNGQNQNRNGNTMNQPRNPPPQHRASNQPINSQPRARNLRQLTENEETIRRMKGLTHEQFLDWQNASEEEFMTMERPK